MAWNYGGAFRRRGGELSSLSPLLPQRRALTLQLRELDALQRLGEDQFNRWAVRGWFEDGDRG